MAQIAGPKESNSRRLGADDARSPAFTDPCSRLPTWVSLPAWPSSHQFRSTRPRSASCAGCRAAPFPWSAQPRSAADQRPIGAPFRSQSRLQRCAPLRPRRSCRRPCTGRRHRPRGGRSRWHSRRTAPRGPTCAGRPVRGVATFADELAGHGGGQVHRAGLSRQHAAQRRPGARQSGIRDHRRLHKGQQLAGRVGVLQGARQQRSLILGGQGSGCDHRSMSHTSGMW